MRILKRMPFKAKRAVWDKLLEVADVASLSQKEHEAYQRALMNYWDYHNTMEAAIQEGMEKGMEKGKTEGKIETARNLKQLGVSMDVIVQATGLSETEIQQL